MTKKRFKLIYINKQNISANLYDNGIFIGSIEHGEKLIVEVLNQLSDENEQLKEENKLLQKTLDDTVELFKKKIIYGVYCEDKPTKERINGLGDFE